MNFEATPKGLPVRTPDGKLYQDWILTYTNEIDTAGHHVGVNYYGGEIRLPYGALEEAQPLERYTRCSQSRDISGLTQFLVWRGFAPPGVWGVPTLLNSGWGDTPRTVRAFRGFIQKCINTVTTAISQGIGKEEAADTISFETEENPPALHPGREVQ